VVTSPLQRAKHLLAKAVDPATSEEEARTTALIACRLIASSGIELVSRESDRSAPGMSLDSSDPDSAFNALFNIMFGGAQKVMLTHPRACAHCGRPCAAGTAVWYRRGQVAHEGCWAP
jgi:hypothetical protein